LVSFRSYVGYVFLVDTKQQVRWRGVGAADALELELLYSSVEKLAKEEQEEEVEE
jgi:hypothetical protein